MPSPLGHALAGAAAGWAVVAIASHKQSSVGVWRTGALCALCGMLPDVDLVLGGHRGPSHGLGTVAIFALAAGFVTRSGAGGLAAGAAYASHLLLDWLGSDSSPPIGIMALWPFSREYFESDLHLFEAISRRYWLAGFWKHNLRAVARELLILVPPALVVFAIVRRRARSGGPISK